jgi:hypothetical protein
MINVSKVELPAAIANMPLRDRPCVFNKPVRRRCAERPRRPRRTSPVRTSCTPVESVEPPASRDADPPAPPRRDKALLGGAR